MLFWKVASLRVKGLVQSQRFRSVGAVGIVELADDGESGDATEDPRPVRVLAH